MRKILCFVLVALLLSGCKSFSEGFEKGMNKAVAEKEVTTEEKEKEFSLSDLQNVVIKETSENYVVISKFEKTENSYELEDGPYKELICYANITTMNAFNEKEKGTVEAKFANDELVYLRVLDSVVVEK